MAAQNYEAMVVFSLKNGEEALAALKERFQTLIEQNGTVAEVKEWGRRLLKYPIKKETEGYYMLYYFSAEPEFPLEFQRIAGISDGVLRTLVIRHEGK
ncbi:MAG: 30S ribosomal protein S6 [Oscillospiraceae bacterium]|jgi:small subunit ribosomal protein S6|nr:30S ribosomal protein S6 [Oscillospiraceae bacterium]